MVEPTTGLRAAHVTRDAVVVEGPDAVAYLQGQLSQDVAALGVGASGWSWLLQPAGKVDALVRVTRTGPDSLLVDVDGGHGDAVLQRLSRFKLRTKAELSLTTVEVTALRGPGALEAAAGLAAARVGGAGDIPSSPVVVGALWSGEEAADVLQGAVAGHDGAGDDVAGSGGVRALAVGEWEVERIAAGVPAMGAELTERTIPAETGLVDVTVSFTKGCYTGQELVARIDSRGGNVPRHLRVLRSDAPLAVGDELTAGEGKVVGTVTSAAAGGRGGPVALAYVARSVAPGDVVTAPSGPVRVTVPPGAPTSG